MRDMWGIILLHTKTHNDFIKSHDRHLFSWTHKQKIAFCTINTRIRAKSPFFFSGRISINIPHIRNTFLSFSDSVISAQLSEHNTFKRMNQNTVIRVVHFGNVQKICINAYKLALSKRDDWRVFFGFCEFVANISRSDWAGGRVCVCVC